ncbi:hypothetical protein JCM10212_001800 [Sporobolomyces blumeae]
MSLPGTYDRSDSEPDHTSSSEIDMADLHRTTQGISTSDDDDDDDSDDDDDDFEPALLGDDDEEIGIDDDDDDDDEELGDTQDPRDEEDDQPDEQSGGQLRIGFDPSTGAILLIDANGNPRRLRSQDLRGTALSLASIRSMLLNRFGRAVATGPGDDDDDDPDYDDDEDDDWGMGAKQWYDIPTEPQEAGVNLERSGLFSRIPSKYSSSRTLEWSSPTSHATSFPSYFRARELSYRAPLKSDLGATTVPNSAGVEVSQFTSKVYSGQYSNDGAFFYSACKDFCIYIYDTHSPPRVGSKSVTDTARTRTRTGYNYDWQHRTSLKTTKIVHADPSNCRWTITDAELSDDNQWLCYSSISLRAHLVKTGANAGGSIDSGVGVGGDDDEQSTINFASGGRYGGFGIWSLRFNHNASEVVAGASGGQMFVYDIEAQRTILRVNAHRDDVNAVAFGSASDSNLLLSGSDDCFVKVWDRRSLEGERASGVLVGHTEGITWVSPKGDGRYCVSNGKDQGMKLWDLRMMTSDADFERLRLDRKNYSSGYDYRSGFYPKPRYKQHPHDTSVMTYRGHSVVSTLIRCHWSPVATTGQRYLVSGSADGKIHIWSLDGRIVEVLDRSATHPLINKTTGEYNDPSDWSLRRPHGKRRGAAGGSIRNSYGGMVRDVSWHPDRPELMSTSWEERGSVEGSIAVHQWSGRKGESLEDEVERRKQEVKG